VAHPGLATGALGFVVLLSDDVLGVEPLERVDGFPLNNQRVQ
jgi:hypothetical protein